MVARLLGASARYESEHKGERQRRQIRQFAEAGHQVAGGRRPYGYKLQRGDGRIKATVDPVEGPIVQECARRGLAPQELGRDRTHGQSWLSIARCRPGQGHDGKQAERTRVFAGTSAIETVT